MRSRYRHFGLMREQQHHDQHRDGQAHERDIEMPAGAHPARPVADVVLIIRQVAARQGARPVPERAERGGEREPGSFRQRRAAGHATGGAVAGALRQRPQEHLLHRRAEVGEQVARRRRRRGDVRHHDRARRVGGGLGPKWRKPGGLSWPVSLSGVTFWQPGHSSDRIRPRVDSRPGQARAAGEAARAAMCAASAAYVHPLADAHQVKHMLGAAAHAARVAERLAGDDREVGAERIERARRRASSAVVAVLTRYPAAPPGGRVGALLRELDAALRGRC